jgi:hypothetical protein
MTRAFIVLGVVLDVLIALFLVLVFGWIVDSWHDPKGVWVGLAPVSDSTGLPALAARPDFPRFSRW